MRSCDLCPKEEVDQGHDIDTRKFVGAHTSVRMDLCEVCNEAVRKLRESEFRKIDQAMHVAKDDKLVEVIDEVRKAMNPEPETEETEDAKKSEPAAS